jgi:hypothetical protein
MECLRIGSGVNVLEHGAKLPFESKEFHQKIYTAFFSCIEKKEMKNLLVLLGRYDFSIDELVKRVYKIIRENHYGEDAKLRKRVFDLCINDVRESLTSSSKILSRPVDENILSRGVMYHDYSDDMYDYRR